MQRLTAAVLNRRDKIQEPTTTHVMPRSPLKATGRKKRFASQPARVHTPTPDSSLSLLWSLNFSGRLKVLPPQRRFAISLRI